ncbi:1325_t:CDS:2, partial [Acaulospora colombiana]
SNSDARILESGTPPTDRYEYCLECEKALTEFGWCRFCHTKELKNDFPNWTSDNKDLDKIIQKSQLDATEFAEFIEWIQWDQFSIFEFLGKGKFSTVYSAYWIEGPRRTLDGEIYVIRDGPIKVAIKVIENSRNISKGYLNRIARYLKCIQNRSLAEFFGVTRDESGNYAFVMKFYENGSLNQYLDYAMGIFCWRDMVDMLYGISKGLDQIHKYGLYHGNLHCGNLLVENEPGSIDIRISDVGLHCPAEESTTAIYGVLPYVAPEILRGEPYTQAADVYSFGIIMWTLPAGVRPFCDRAHDVKLAQSICDGLCPEVVDGTPEVYAELMSRCLDRDPTNRPNVSEICDILERWIIAICDDPNPSSLSDQFDAAEEKKFAEFESKAFTRPEIHPQASYISQPLDFPELRTQRNPQHQHALGV